MAETGARRYYLMASAHSLAVSFWWRQDVCYYQWALLSIAAVTAGGETETAFKTHIPWRHSPRNIPVAAAASPRLAPDAQENQTACAREADGSFAQVAVPAQVRSFEGISSLSAASVAAVAVALVVMGIQFVAGGVRDGGEPAAWAPPNDMTVWLAFDSISATTFAYPRRRRHLPPRTRRLGISAS